MGGPRCSKQKRRRFHHCNRRLVCPGIPAYSPSHASFSRYTIRFQCGLHSRRRRSGFDAADHYASAIKKQREAPFYRRPFVRFPPFFLLPLLHRVIQTGVNQNTEEGNPAHTEGVIGRRCLRGASASGAIGAAACQSH